MKIFYRIITAVLLLSIITSTLVSCKGDKGGEQTDTTPVETQTPTDTGADGEKVEPIPEVPNKENSIMITGNELLELIRNGAIAENGDYAITDGSYLTFDRDDDNKTYDLKNAVIRVGARDGEAGVSLGNSRGMTLSNARIAIYGGIGVDTAKSRTATLTKIHITGNAKTGILLNGKQTTVDGCTVTPEEGGTIESAVLAVGSELVVTNCTLKGNGVGVTDRSEDGTVIENNIIENCTVGVLCETANTTVWYNTVKGGEAGIKAVDDKSEISAGEATVYNILAAMNDIKDARTSVVYENVSNCVILLNTLDSVSVTGSTNVYVNENAVSGKLTLNKNDYMIANGNIAGTLDARENTNVNGDNVTDITARASVGANEELLPHINKEQFVGMKRKSEVRDASGSYEFGDYLSESMKAKKTVIVPPGAYANLAMSMEGLSDVKVYAYGVLNEMPESTGKGNALTLTNCSDIIIKGLFFGTAVYSFTQGTVSESYQENGRNTVRFYSDPGYHEDFTSTNGKFNNVAVGYYFEEGEMTPMIDLTQWSVRTHDPITKRNTLVSTGGAAYFAIKKGHRIGFRSGAGDGGVCFMYCTGIKLEDVTVTSSAGFAEYDENNEVAPVLHRYCVTTGPAPVLDSTKKYDDKNGVIWTDEYGRMRSAEPLFSTCDATHSTNARVGMTAVNCLLEHMYDDGGNINANYSVLDSFTSSTKTLVYTTSDVNGYQLFGADFRVGDDVLLYSMVGDYIGTAKVTEATRVLTDTTKSIKIDTYFDFPTDVKVVVQNASASGRGFLWDNVVVRESAANGLRIKAPGGEVRNCSFDNVRCNGISCSPEYMEWPECGYARDVKILNNVFTGLGRSATLWEDWTEKGQGASISFSATGATSKLENCMHTNIEISGNVFRDSYARYEIVLGAVSNVSITDNTFENRNSRAWVLDTGVVILINTCNGVEISDNTFGYDFTYGIENNNGNGLNVYTDLPITTVHPILT